jgi:hypothetical protein
MAGWPWPLDAVQAWFEGLWSWILEACNTAVSAVEGWVLNAANWIWTQVQNLGKGILDGLTWLWNQLSTWVTDSANWIVTQITNFVSWLWAGLSDVGTWLWNQITGGLDWLKGLIDNITAAIGPAISGVISTISSAVNNFGNWLVQIIWGWVDGSLRWLSDTFLWLKTQIDAAGDYVITEVTTAFDGAFAGITEFFGSLPDVLLNIFKSIWEWLQSIFSLGSTPGPWVDISASYNLIPFSAAFLAAKPAITEPGSAWQQLRQAGDQGQAHFDKMQLGLAALEAFTVGMLDVNIAGFMNAPKIKAWTDLAMKAQTIEWEVGLIPLAQQEIRKKWLPSIPGPADLIHMVVREAFMPEMVVEAPPVFAEKMELQGYSKEWSDRYWTAHFEPIALRQAYENLWRGYWDKERFMYALHIADIHPMWREDIYNVAYTPPSIRELGYGYDTGVYTVEDIIKYRRWSGLSPEDAAKSGLAMVAYRTEAEREALRREAIADYVAGLDDEAELRAKLNAIGGRPEIIDLWVARAKYREARDIAMDLIKVVKDQYVKGYLTDEELAISLEGLGVKPGRIWIHVEEAQTRRAKYKAVEDLEKKKNLAEAKITKALELGLIGSSEFKTKLIERGYTAEDAQLLLEIATTPLPVTAEELERRRASIMSRLNRARRRYEKLILGVDQRTGVIAEEVESLSTEMKEALDVINASIAYTTEELTILGAAV